MLDDGVLGLRAVGRCGGVTIVQEPAEAPYPDMVESALASITVDYRLPVAEITTLLNRLAQELVATQAEVPGELRQEVAINLSGGGTLEERARMLERMTAEAEGRGRERSAADLREQATETQRDAQNVRRFLLERAP